MSDGIVIIFGLLMVCLMIGVPTWILVAARNATKNEPALQLSLRQKAYRTIKRKRIAIVFLAWIGISIAGALAKTSGIPVVLPGTLLVWIFGYIWVQKANDIVFEKPFADEI